MPWVFQSSQPFFLPRSKTQVGSTEFRDRSAVSGCRSRSELRIEIRLEGFELGGDGFALGIFRRDGIGGLEPVSGDRDHGDLIGADASFPDQLLCHPGGYAACG